MPVVFKVQFDYVCQGDRPQGVSVATCDSERTVAANDAEDAIRKVRASIRREKYPVCDDDGDPTGKELRYLDIEVAAVTRESFVEVI